MFVLRTTVPCRNLYKLTGKMHRTDKKGVRGRESETLDSTDMNSFSAAFTLRQVGGATYLTLVSVWLPAPWMVMLEKMAFTLILPTPFSIWILGTTRGSIEGTPSSGMPATRYLARCWMPVATHLSRLGSCLLQGLMYSAARQSPNEELESDSWANSNALSRYLCTCSSALALVQKINFVRIMINFTSCNFSKYPNNHFIDVKIILNVLRPSDLHLRSSCKRKFCFYPFRET